MNEALRDREILLVEDDELVAMTVEDMLLFSNAGAVVVARDVASARQALAGRRFDCAILDVNLRGETSWPVAAELRQLGIPYLVVTGDGDRLEHELAGKVLGKPYSVAQLLDAVAGLLR